MQKSKKENTMTISIYCFHLKRSRIQFFINWWFSFKQAIDTLNGYVSRAIIQLNIHFLFIPTTATVVTTHADVNALVIGGICMYSCWNVWKAMIIWLYSLLLLCLHQNEEIGITLRRKDLRNTYRYLYFKVKVKVKVNKFYFTYGINNIYTCNWTYYIFYTIYI